MEFAQLEYLVSILSWLRCQCWISSTFLWDHEMNNDAWPTSSGQFPSNLSYKVVYMEGIKYVNLIEISSVVIEIRGVENGDLAVPINNTLVYCMSFLAADTWPCVLIYNTLTLHGKQLFLKLVKPQNYHVYLYVYYMYAHKKLAYKSSFKDYESKKGVGINHCNKK